jgi:hypothetical protein
MILKRYGEKLQSVRPNFDANAMTEISFLRDKESSFTPDELGRDYELVEEHELTASSEGHVKSLAEHAALHYLEEQLLDLEEQLRDHGVLVVENATGQHAPKTRSKQRTLVEDGENRLHFRFTIEPPLRVAVYRRR